MPHSAHEVTQTVPNNINQSSAVAETERERVRPTSRRRRLTAGLVGLSTAALLLTGCSDTDPVATPPQPVTTAELTPDNAVHTTEAPTPSSSSETSTSPTSVTTPISGEGTLAPTPEKLIETFQTFSNNGDNVIKVAGEYPDGGIPGAANTFTAAEAANTYINKEGIEAHQKLIRNLLTNKVVSAWLENDFATFTPEAITSSNADEAGLSLVRFTDLMRRQATMIDPITPHPRTLEAIDAAYLNPRQIKAVKDGIKSGAWQGFPIAAHTEVLDVFQIPARNYGIVPAIATVTKYQPDNNGRVLSQFRWTVVIPVGKLAPGDSADTAVGICIYEKDLGIAQS